MQTESAFGAQRGSFAGAPTGFRKLTPGLLQADRAAECFDGLPDEVDFHGQLLAAFKAAAPRLGLSVRLVHALDWLFRFTRPQDWEPGGRPIVWPSAATQQEALGLSESRVKSINRGLIDAGLVTMKDSPSGKRWGVRDGDGQIVEAYGFDLSPIATRHAEFVRLAAEAKAERELIGRLRRRATIARKAIAQILETVAEYGFGDGEWSRLRLDTAALVRSLRRFERPEEIAIGVASLERRQTEAKERLEKLLDAVNSGPSGPENRPHTIPTNPAFYSNETVVAPEGCRSASDPVPPGETPERGEAARGREERDSAAAGAAPGTGHPLPRSTGRADRERTAAPSCGCPSASCWPSRRGSGATSKPRPRRGPRSSMPPTGCAAKWGSRNTFGARRARPWAARPRRSPSRWSRPNRRSISARRRAAISTAWWQRRGPANSILHARSGVCASRPDQRPPRPEIAGSP